jgi:NAD-dependent SIR2 family protein deacetylase
MFSMDYFLVNQKPFFDFASEIYPGKFQPAPCHRFIKALEANGKLIRNYAQNIDTLESVAGIDKVINCHGSFNTASCLVCKNQVPGSAIEADVMAQKIPLCPLPCCAEAVNQFGTQESTLRPINDHPIGSNANSDDDDDDDDDAGELPDDVPLPGIEDASPDTAAPAPTSARGGGGGAPDAAGAGAAVVGGEGAGAGAVATTAAASSPAVTTHSGWTVAERPFVEGRHIIAHGRRWSVVKPVMKPDITFFGEDLPQLFHDSVHNDCQDCDLVLVIGSSLQVSNVRSPGWVPWCNPPPTHTLSHVAYFPVG